MGAKLGANEGSHWATPGLVQRLSSQVNGTVSDARRRRATGGCVLWEQEAASSNLAIPTRSEYMSILVKIVYGAEAGASVRQFRTRRTVGPDFGHASAQVSRCR